jgi:hypothetical protein
MSPGARIAVENSGQATERQVQQSRGNIHPGIMGAHAVIEQRDFPKPLRRFDQCNDQFLARWRDGAEVNGARKDAIDAIARITAVEYGLADAEHHDARRCQDGLLKRGFERGEPFAAFQHGQLRLC